MFTTPMLQILHSVPIIFQGTSLKVLLRLALGPGISNDKKLVDAPLNMDLIYLEVGEP